ncbi:ABC transporter permease [Streptomyces sp. NPDC002088]|uniref:ABC transporter permease n=1 Tax=Streptomyces sp. NPDC002088 TaxID=3154665 RepID=UPI00331C84D8
MSTLTAPAPARSSRPSGPSWLVLRLHRPALLVWAVVVVVGVALTLWLGGPLTDASADAWRQYNACTQPTCPYDQDAITTYKSVALYAAFIVALAPLAVAAWAGGALFGREVEDGTAQLAWTQSVSPARWLAVKLAWPAALIVVGLTPLALLYHRAWSAGQGRIDTIKPWTDVLTYTASGPVPVAVALFALAFGAVAALRLGRALPALGLTGAASFGVWSIAEALRIRLWPTVTRVAGLDSDSIPGTNRAETVERGIVTSGGTHVAGDSTCYLPGYKDAPGCATKLEQLHATGYYADVHPYSHFWPLQLMESGVVLALAAVTAFVAFWLLRRRTA